LLRAVSTTRITRFALKGEGWFVVGAVLVTALILFVPLGETFSAGDLDNIRAAETRLLEACGNPERDARARAAAVVLARYAHRDPDQPLPLHGAGPARGMRAELTWVQASLSSSSCSRDAAVQALLVNAIKSP
jgi:hypothetical protein